MVLTGRIAVAVLGNCDSRPIIQNVDPQSSVPRRTIRTGRICASKKKSKNAKIGCGGAAGCVTFDLSQAGRSAAADFCNSCMFDFFVFISKEIPQQRAKSESMLDLETCSEGQTWEQQNTAAAW